jgi:Pentapeptide repeats (8 copies)
VKGLQPGNAEWFGVNLQGATLAACDFRGCDLRGAIVSATSRWECHFIGANLEDADLTGATFDTIRRWPAGFDPYVSQTTIICLVFNGQPRRGGAGVTANEARVCRV